MTLPLSIVIPSYKDHEHVRHLLEDLKRQKDILFEIIVVKGEGGFETYRENHVVYVSSQKGRALQMNKGAREAKAPCLLFLHADSRLFCDKQLKRAYDEFSQFSQTFKAGHFPLRFKRSNFNKKLSSYFYFYLERKTHLNFPSTVHGDQGLWIEKRFFQDLREFDESFEFLEDVLLAQKMENLKGFSWILFKDPLMTSARRFEELGEFEVYTLMHLVILALHLKKNDFLNSVLYSSFTKPTFKLSSFLHRFNTLFYRPQNIYSLGKIWSFHMWQMFFVFDCLLFKTSCPLTKLYRTYFSWVFMNPLSYCFLGLLSLLFYLVFLPVVFFVREKRT